MRQGKGGGTGKVVEGEHGISRNKKVHERIVIPTLVLYAFECGL